MKSIANRRSNTLRSTWMRVPIVLIALTAFTFVSPVPDASASTAGARRAAAVLFDVLRNNGWTVRDSYQTGLLSYRDEIIVETTLYAGNSYKLVAAGCEDAYDVDIAVFDENGNFIDGDDDTEQVAVADVTPKWSGTFFVKITMYDSTRNGAHWVLQYAYQ